MIRESSLSDPGTMFQEIFLNVPGNRTIEDRSRYSSISFKVFQDIVQGGPGNHSKMLQEWLMVQKIAEDFSRKLLKMSQKITQNISKNSQNVSRKTIKFTRIVAANDQEVPLNHSDYSRKSFNLFQEPLTLIQGTTQIDPMNHSN